MLYKIIAFIFLIAIYILFKSEIKIGYLLDKIKNINNKRNRIKRKLIKEKQKLAKLYERKKKREDKMENQRAKKQ